MRCFECGYTLWNLTEPRCPECGRAFDLRDYRFPVGKVAFACSECGHRHGGTGEYGHPTDKDTCVCRGCGKLIETARMQVVPLGDATAAEPARLTPWERRDTLGFWRGWFRTTVLSLFQPGRLGQMVGPWTRPMRAFWFAAFNSIVAVMPLLVCGLVSMLVTLVFELIANATTNQMQQLDTVIMQLLRVVWMSCFGVAALAIALLPLVILTHGLIWISGPRRGGLGLTFAALSYGYGPVVLMVLPACGAVIAIVWICASSIVVLSRAQQVSMGRAAAAVLALPVGGVLLAALIYGVMTAW